MRHRTTLNRLVPALVLASVLAVTVMMGLNSLGVAPAQGEDGDSTFVASQADAADWLIENATPDERLIVVDAMSAGLIDAGWRRGDVYGYEERGADARTPLDVLQDWRSAHYLVATDTRLALPVVATPLSQAVQNSVVVASFGEGSQAVEIRRIVPEGAVLASVAQLQAAADRMEYGAELAENSAVRMSDAARAQLVAGSIDRRVVVVLGALAAEGDVTVAEFPTVDGEEAGPVRGVAIAELAGTALVSDGRLTPDADELLRGLEGTFEPDAAWADGGALVLQYSLSIEALED